MTKVGIELLEQLKMCEEKCVKKNSVKEISTRVGPCERAGTQLSEYV